MNEVNDAFYRAATREHSKERLPLIIHVGHNVALKLNGEV